VAHFPRGKLVMTAPAELPLYGRVNLRETTKEALLAFWSKVKSDTGLAITYDERVERIEREGQAFRLVTTRGSHLTGAVLLAIGRRGTPRTLGVPGEDQEKVVYRLIEAEQYRNSAVLVVGGGDSALEAATTIAAEEGTVVTLSYRGDGFNRAKSKNRDRVAEMENSGKLRVMLQSDVRQIEPKHVTIEHAGVTERLSNDAVIVCAGGILPTPFLKSAGINIETKYGTA
jgi:thioredoxin reductase (NADPH)